MPRIKLANKNTTNARMKNGLDFIHGGGCEELATGLRDDFYTVWRSNP
jgi:hypothetical protein